MALFSREDNRIRVPAGAVVMREGESGDVMFILLEGELAITVHGKRIDFLTPGMVLGEMAMVDDRPRSATATAETDACLIQVDRARFRELVREEPQFALRVMSIMSGRTRRLIEEEIKYQRVEEELAIGRRIQLSLLPRDCPLIRGYSVTAGYRAAREVGGDLYDFIFQPDEPSKVHFVVGDVTGKGVPAALYMAVSRTLLRTQALEGRRPSEALRRVNEFIRQDESSPLFLSAFYAVLDTESGGLTYANAGHNPPLWLRWATGEIIPLQSRGLLLGAFDQLITEEQSCFIEPGDYVVFFTDGITEARNTVGEFLDDEGLEAIIRSQRPDSAEELLSAIILGVDQFAAGAPQADDFTVLVLRRQLPKS